MHYVSETLLLLKVILGIGVGYLMLRRAYINHFRNHEFRPLISALGIYLIATAISDAYIIYAIKTSTIILSGVAWLVLSGEAIALLIFVYSIMYVAGLLKSNEIIEKEVEKRLKNISSK